MRTKKKKPGTATTYRSLDKRLKQFVDDVSTASAKTRWSCDHLEAACYILVVSTKISNKMDSFLLTAKYISY